jgi:uncharacterized protein (DUF169 family)
MEREWIDQSEKLTDLLAFERKPVAITFTNEQVEVKDTKRTWLCRALKLAAEGQSFVIDAETSACGGGSWHCGLIEQPSGEGRRALQAFLTAGEKLTSTIVSFNRMQSLGSPPPTGMSDRVLIGPMEDAGMRPDIVVFLCDPEQACRLITLDHFWDGIPPRIELSGSLCHSAISYPIVTGRTNLTLGDWTARRMQKFDKEIVFVTIPYERMHNLVLAIPRCSAGTGDVELPEPFRRVFEQEGLTENL